MQLLCIMIHEEDFDDGGRTVKAITITEVGLAPDVTPSLLLSGYQCECGNWTLIVLRSYHEALMQ